jgi:hypothetical protein
MVMAQKCIGCGRLLIRADEQRNVGRMIKAGMTAREARAQSPRCQRRTAILLARSCAAVGERKREMVK